MYAVHGQSHGHFSSGSLLAILLLQPFEFPFSSHLANKAGAFGLDVLILARQVHRVTVKVHVNAIELDSGLDEFLRITAVLSAASSHDKA